MMYARLQTFHNTSESAAVAKTVSEMFAAFSHDCQNDCQNASLCCLLCNSMISVVLVDVTTIGVR